MPQHINNSLISERFAHLFDALKKAGMLQKPVLAEELIQIIIKTIILQEKNINEIQCRLELIQRQLSEVQKNGNGQ